MDWLLPWLVNNYCRERSTVWCIALRLYLRLSRMYMDIEFRLFDVWIELLLWYDDFVLLWLDLLDQLGLPDWLDVQRWLRLLLAAILVC